MTTPATFEPQGMLRALSEHDVAFVVIGGFACEMHGVAHTTVDMDIIMDDSEENATALLHALESMNALHARLPGSHQVIRPTVTRILTTTGDQHYDTKYGRLDVLKESGGYTYASLAAGVFVAEISGYEVALADLATVADMKTQAGRDKDKRALPAILRRLHEIEDDAETRAE